MGCNREEIHTLKEDDGRVFSVAFSPDGRTLASGGFNGVIRLWHVATGKLIFTLPKRGANGYSIAYSPDGNTIISSGLGIQCWDIETGKHKELIDFGENMQGFNGIHNCMINFIAISTDGKFEVDGGEMGGIRLWDYETGEVKLNPSGHKWRVSSCAFSPDGTTFVTASFDGTILLWDVPQ
ncbi:hypothetical protein F4212_03530 [Candidatus Poribacteria bacterium]|nr:hypothetical protein [Candidatus Poribacteria bacterium]